MKWLTEFKLIRKLQFQTFNKQKLCKVKIKPCLGETLFSDAQCQIRLLQLRRGSDDKKKVLLSRGQNRQYISSSLSSSIFVIPQEKILLVITEKQILQNFSCLPHHLW